MRAYVCERERQRAGGGGRERQRDTDTERERELGALEREARGTDEVRWMTMALCPKEWATLVC